MHDDNAFDDEELFTEDGELKDEYIADDPESEENDNDENNGDDDDDGYDDDMGMVEDEEGNLVYPEDNDPSNDDF
ncbi:MAG: hypothetical protein WCI51_04700 [Lentisphaerota bacterium]